MSRVKGGGEEQIVYYVRLKTFARVTLTCGHVIERNTKLRGPRTKHNVSRSGKQRIPVLCPACNAIAYSLKGGICPR